MKRCAIYARYSSDLQSPTSIEDLLPEPDKWKVGLFSSDWRSRGPHTAGLATRRRRTYASGHGLTVADGTRQ